MRRIVAVTILIALTLAPIPSAAADDQVALSGTIVAGTYLSAGGGCGIAVDCRAWLETGCDPALSGRNPALMASIEDVAHLADGLTPWHFEYETAASPGGFALVQLWQQDCTEITSRALLQNSSFLQIPASTKWMTVTALADNPPWPPTPTTGSLTFDWTLTGQRTAPPESSPDPAPSQSPTPDPSPANEPAAVERSVDLVLRGHLRSVGAVGSDDAACHSDVAVVIQRKTSAGWLEVRSTTTDAEGAFALRLRDRSGRYRAIAPQVDSSETICLGATSATVRHRH